MRLEYAGMDGLKSITAHNGRVRRLHKWLLRNASKLPGSAYYGGAVIQGS